VITKEYWYRIDLAKPVGHNDVFLLGCVQYRQLPDKLVGEIQVPGRNRSKSTMMAVIR
jgi:hypothetical protein